MDPKDIPLEVGTAHVKDSMARLSEVIEHAKQVLDLEASTRLDPIKEIGARRAATDAYAEHGDDIEIDDDAPISEGDPDGGCFVQAWVWVTPEQRAEGERAEKEAKKDG